MVGMLERCRCGCRVLQALDPVDHGRIELSQRSGVGSMRGELSRSEDDASAGGRLVQKA